MDGRILSASYLYGYIFHELEKSWSVSVREEKDSVLGLADLLCFIRNISPVHILLCKLYRSYGPCVLELALQRQTGGWEGDRMGGRGVRIETVWEENEVKPEDERVNDIYWQISFPWALTYEISPRWLCHCTDWSQQWVSLMNVGYVFCFF